MTSKPLHYVTWDTVNQYVDLLAEDIKRSGHTITLIAGVTRGGLVPAVMLSHRLGIPMTAIAPNEMIEHDHETLILDEIYDTGKTFAKLKELNPRAKFAALITNRFLPEIDYPVVRVALNNWYVFPWENKGE